MGCRLYLEVPAEVILADETPGLTRLGAELAGTLDAADIACVLLRHGDLAPERLRAAVFALRDPVQERDIAFLVEDDPALAAETGCDGVHLGNYGLCKAARGRLGPEAVVGVGCGRSRHAAMVAGEQGADYVGFGDPALPLEDAPEPASDEGVAEDFDLPALLSWWQSLMTLPCVGFGARTPDEAAAQAAAGADFVSLGAPVWRDPEGPAAALGAAARAIASVRASC